MKHEHNFYHCMSHSQKNKIVYVVLREYYNKFFFFFNDLEYGQFSEKNFIRKMLSSLDC